MPGRRANRHAVAPGLREDDRTHGQQWLVENRGGAGGNVGVDVLAKSEPDGYTLGLGGIAAHAIAPTLYAKLPFNARTDFTFVSTLWWLPNLLAVNLEVPAKSVAELMFDNITGTLTQSRAGKVRPLGVTSAKRTPVAPEIPTIAEILPGFDVVSWTTLTGPAKMPPDAVARLSELSRKALESADVKARFADLGSTAWWQTPAETLLTATRKKCASPPLSAPRVRV